MILGRKLGSEELASLALFLQQREFSVGTAQVLAAQRLLWRMAEQGVSKSSHEMARWLAPVFAANAVELDRFSDLYEQWHHSTAPPPLPEPARIRKRRRLLVVSLAAVVLIAAAAGIWWKQTPAPNLPAAPPDAGGVRTGRAPKRSVSPNIIPSQGPAMSTVTGALIDDAGQPVANARLLFDGQTTSSDATGSFTITGPTGQPVLAVHCDDDAAAFPLVSNPNLVVRTVRKRSPGCDIRGSGSKDVNEPRARYQRIRAAATVLPVIVFLFWAAYVYWKRIGLKRWRGAASMEFSQLEVGADPVFSDTELQRSVQELRRPRPIPVWDMWPEPTVNATVEQGGWFTPVYRARRRATEYLVLIDRTGKRDQQASFARELLDCLTSRGVTAHAFHFNADPRTCTETATGRLSPLTDLSARFGHCQVWVVADAKVFFNAFTGGIERWADLFQQWPSRVLLTPSPLSHWDDPERRLADLSFEIIPASPRGLARIAQHLAEDEIALDSWPPSLEERPARWLANQPPPRREMARLSTELLLYLGRDGFRLMAACAQYPVIEWPLTRYLGQALMPAETLEPVLRKLVRLPWFRRGSMPDWLRTALVTSDKDLRLRVHRLLARRLTQTESLASSRPGASSSVEVALKRDYQKRIEEDEVWVSILWGREPGFALPATRLFRLLFHRGRLWQGVRPLALLVATCALSAATWLVMGYWVPPSYRSPEPAPEQFVLDIAMSQYHDASYYLASAPAASFPDWCYQVAQLVLQKKISLTKAAPRAPLKPGAVSRNAKTAEMGIVADSGWSLVFEGGRIVPRANPSLYEVVALAPGSPAPSIPVPPSPYSQLGPSVDWSPQMLPVRDAGQEGSATGFAVAAAMEFQIRQQLGKAIRLSPRYIYYLARARTGPLGDMGASITDVLHDMQETGAVAEDVWPYKAGEYAQKPPPQTASATHYRLVSAARINAFDVRRALAAGPVVAGVPVYTAFESQSVAMSGIVPLPTAKALKVGEQTLCIVGYDDRRRQYKFINSWGAGWGRKGYGYLPYDYPQMEFWQLSGIITTGRQKTNPPAVAASQPRTVAAGTVRPPSSTDLTPQKWDDASPVQAWCYQDEGQSLPREFSVQCHSSERNCKVALRRTQNTTTCQLVGELDKTGWKPQHPGYLKAWYQTSPKSFAPPFPQLSDPPIVEFSLKGDVLKWKVTGKFEALKINSNPAAFEVAFPNSSEGTILVSREGVDSFSLLVSDFDLNTVVEREVSAK